MGKSARIRPHLIGRQVNFLASEKLRTQTGRGETENVSTGRFYFKNRTRSRFCPHSIHFVPKRVPIGLPSFSYTKYASLKRTPHPDPHLETHRPSDCQTNTTCRATLGLRTLYAAVEATASRKRPRASSENSVFPQDDGLFVGEESGVLESAKEPGGKGRGALMTSRVSTESLSTMPLLGHRYRYVSTIGTWKFADVIRCVGTEEDPSTTACGCRTLKMGQPDQNGQPFLGILR